MELIIFTKLSVISLSEGGILSFSSISLAITRKKLVTYSSATLVSATMYIPFEIQSGEEYPHQNPRF